jgi:hypothetical protein
MRMRVGVGGLYSLLSFVPSFLFGSNLGRHTNYSEIYSGFPQSLDANSAIVPELSHYRFLPNSFLHDYLALALPFDVMSYWQRHEVTEKYSQPFYGIRRFVPVATTASRGLHARFADRASSVKVASACVTYSDLTT